MGGPQPIRKDTIILTVFYYALSTGWMVKNYELQGKCEEAVTTHFTLLS